jgi:transposase-like protein
MTRKRSEAALISLVQEAFINGVSTRKMERLARSLGIESLSASQVSEITRELDERVKESRTRPLKAEYVFVSRDALYEKVRFEGKVVSVAIMIAYGVDGEGRREILAVEPMWEETEESWRDFFLRLNPIFVFLFAISLNRPKTGPMIMLMSKLISWVLY